MAYPRATVTYTVKGQLTNVPPGSTTGVTVVNSKSELVTFPTASASEYIQSGYTSASTGAGVASGNSGSSTDDASAGPGSSQVSLPSAANENQGLASSRGIATSNAESPSAISSGAIGPSGMGGSGAGSSSTTQPRVSSISTIPASTPSMAIFTGGASRGRVSTSTVAPILAMLFAGAVLI